jgi:8-oxo-dGTP pyrophosphatase MutT (NUDIX family)
MPPFNQREATSPKTESGQILHNINANLHDRINETLEARGNVIDQVIASSINLVFTHIDGRVHILLSPRLQSEGQPYQVPGGKLEPNETVYEAMVRETFQETGIPIDVVAKYMFVSDVIDVRLIREKRQLKATALFMSYIPADQIKDSYIPPEEEQDKCGQWVWVPRTEIEKMRQNRWGLYGALKDRLNNPEIQKEIHEFLIIISQELP